MFRSSPYDRVSLISDFDSIRIALASPEKIRSWSHGEVTKPETINYRTFKPERDGLFCAKIFGPVTDWECLCGKYKRMKHRGVICDKCGVEVTLSRVRRERLGHIELASPCSHVWFFKGLPSRIGQLLDITLRDLERVLYFEAFVVVQADEESELAEGEVLTDEKKRYLDQDKEKAGTFIAMMGAAGVKELLKKIDLDPLADELRNRMKTESSVQKKLKFARRLKVVESFRKSGNKPEWMVLDVIPVIPPELRPLVPLDGGRFATSDLNDLYRRVINRNNRLKKLMELSAPDVIVRNEKRMLQEAVDALFDNGRRGNVLRGANNRPLKSLSDTLKGKQGRFRQNLLGKRVDYSGRSVIVVGPELKLHQCGLPKQMALELFKPFIYQRLEQRGHCTTIKQAKELVEQQDPVVWDILEEVIKDHPVLLNRAPTLHRLGIQAFEPVLVEGKAIKIHPLVCTAFNADFDGDQMAVHIPLSPEAQVEAEVLMLSSNNILSPSNGAPITTPTQDMVLGLYYLTKSKANAKGEGRTFGSIEEVLLALEMSEVETLTPIKLYYSGPVIDLSTSFDNQNVIHSEPIQYSKQYMETTVGRVILNDRLPEDMPFVNGLLKKRGLMQLVQYCYLYFGRAETVEMIDGLKNLGFNYATKAGLSIGINDMVVPAEKQRLVKGAQKDVMSVEQQYLDGAITHGERYNKIIEIWSKLTERVSDEMFTGLESSDTSGSAINPIYIMADSGARGSKQQIRQLSGMRGLMAKPSGEIIETPITANFREGLNVLQYFISTHGARKGLADTALKTADSGYLTRRLVDVAQDVIITESDCGTNDGIYVESIVESGEVIETLRDRIVGRVSQEQIKDYEGNVILTVNQEITEELAAAIPAAGIERVKIRSVLTCESERGVCRMCYGRNLATGRLVEGGQAVGVIAAQSIGEPGTQLTMRTFHIGGAATRVSEQSTQDAKSDGFAKFIKVVSVRNKDGGLVAMNRNGIVAVVDEKGREKERYQVVYGAKLCVEDGAPVSRHQVLLEWDPYTFSILTEVSGLCHFVDLQEGVTLQEQVDEVTGMSQWVVTDSPDEKRQPQIEIRDANGVAQRKYLIPTNAHLMVRDGEEIHGGDVVAKIPRETTKTKDITGGLPRVVELFEARRPKETAVMSEIDGIVRYGEIVKGQRKIFVTADNKEEREYSLPRGVHINVQQGDRVRAGEPLMDGPRDPHDILAILGEKELQKYLVNEIQEVYRLQGVNINDKHLEVIVRQMMRWIKVEQVGDSQLLLEEVLDKFRFRKINQGLEDEAHQPAVGRPLLMGITKASLATDSFISAASFQETTRVLTEASISGKVDHLRGLKENVIVGRLIPAGTGIDEYRKIKIAGEDEPQEMIPEIEYLSGMPGFGEEMPMDYPPGFGEELPPGSVMVPPTPVE
ncbi:MAG: DNA-directed RNA polymerase subunit beta' [Bryobacterales bacterium]|nr:DNA-directed RNA polymerase subunit beta' [Bryobacterales bacterium]